MQKNRSLSQIVIFTLLVVSTVVWSAFAVFNFCREQSVRTVELHEEMNGTAAQLATSLELPLWNFDMEQVERVVTSSLEEGEVYGVVVYSSDGAVITGAGRDAQWHVAKVTGPLKGEELLKASAPIIRYGSRIGTVEVYVTPRFMQEALRDFLVSTVAGIVTLNSCLVLILFQLLRRILLRPLGAIETYAAEVSAGGSRNTRLPAAGFFGELGRLRSSIVQMTASLAQAQDELVHKLEERVAQRTGELHRAQSELLATARQAGMAEIATNVLHNVGNVLNSVNVSAGIVANSLRDSRVAGLARAVSLLKEHAEDLPHFLSEDEKGKILPGYLEKLALALEGEQQTVLVELGQLTKSVEHIKAIVATQQSYARGGALVEMVRITELLEDALTMNEGALKRHQVQVVREFTEVPPLPLDKSRVLLILVNLISNSKYAMDGVHGEHRMTLSVEYGSEGALRVCVRDDGVGIAPENLSRIFTHGFTTRKDGHGFGLHSCALAAKEMGGVLHAESDGEGRGAAFTLEIPVQGEIPSVPASH
ncbi:ATP-binding protein [Geomonas sp. RF6]|uniref:sensor histidine kinase n=1 Tax=Geomonas sp. RF6 TaxID=2897342 RepID=UPI001E5BBD71|nr:ATP-binding protein [Geomonas sp. RF6]UFS69885.1 ATP-binding protein [Geomonas sp. RF6]